MILKSNTTENPLFNSTHSLIKNNNFNQSILAIYCFNIQFWKHYSENNINAMWQAGTWSQARLFTTNIEPLLSTTSSQCLQLYTTI